MKIGIIVAMSKELNLLLTQIGVPVKSEINGIEIYNGTIGIHTIYAMQCGIGKVNAAISTLSLIETYHPDIIINTGVAGGASTSVNQMDIVIGTRIAYHDVWCGPGTEYGEAAGQPLYFTSERIIVDKIKLANHSKMKFGLICSGDQFIDSKNQIESIKAHFPDVLAVDMESAAISHVCSTKSTPVLIARVISDSPADNDNNAKQYDDFWETAPKQTFSVLTDILNKIG